MTVFYAAPDYPLPAYADGVVYEPVSRKEYAKLAASEDGFRQYYAGERWDALVPVPLHPERRRQRGFNQSAEIAGWLGRRAGIPVVEAIRRVKATAPQARLSRAERLRNLRGSLALAGGFDPQGKRLIICDDVFTTGATADACARVLRRAGAEEVVALTVARR